jgi:hypothetical protein
MPRFSSRRNKSGTGTSRKNGASWLSPDEHERLDSWLPEILAELRPDDPIDDRSYPPTSGSITLYDDGWHRFSNGAHGATALELIAELKGGVDDTTAQSEAETWARRFLAAHPGTASSDGFGTEAALPADSAAAIATEIEEARRAEEVLQRLRRIWAEALPVEPTDLVVRYLHDTRRLTLSQLPKTLRLHPSLPHRWSDTSWPAMLALVQGPGGESVALHRTWLDPETVNKAPVGPPRAALGPVKHGAVRLFETPYADTLLVGEGIETTFAASQMAGWKYAGWAALSTVGIVSLVVPPRYGRVIIAADNDPNEAGVRAARILAYRLHKRGVRVVINTPTLRGTDWNDVLLARRSRKECVA